MNTVEPPAMDAAAPVRNMGTSYRLGIIVVGIFAVIAGVGEIIVGLTGNYLGILSHSMTPAPAPAIVGALYSLGGLFILTLRKWGAALGIGFITAEIAGRVYLVATGAAPSAGSDAIKIVVGGLIAVGVIAYVLTQWTKFK